MQKIKKEAIAFTQTARKGWVLTLTPRELISLVPPRGPEQLSFFTETNRPIVPRHLGEIEKFLLTTPEWALPPITLAATPGTITASKTSIELDPENLRILDGQHRLEAMANLIHIALMMTSAAMFAASPPESAPKIFETRPNVPGEE